MKVMVTVAVVKQKNASETHSKIKGSGTDVPEFRVCTRGSSGTLRARRVPFLREIVVVVEVSTAPLRLSTPAYTHGIAVARKPCTTYGLRTSPEVLRHA